METDPKGVDTPSNPPQNLNLKAAFARAQGEFRTPSLNRSAQVKKDGRLLYETHYADLQECIDCVRKPLAKYGLSFTHTTERRGNDWFLVLELMHESGETKETVLPINVNQASQQLGGTLTYLKRYQFSAFFGLAADYDDDGNATTGNEVTFSEKQSKPKLAPVIEKKPAPPSHNYFKAPMNPLKEIVEHLEKSSKEVKDRPALDRVVGLAKKYGIANSEMSDIIFQQYGLNENDERLKAKELTDEELNELSELLSERYENQKSKRAPALDGSGAGTREPSLL